MNDHKDIDSLKNRDIERREPEGADYIKMVALWLLPGAQSTRVVAWSAVLFLASAGLFVAALWLFSSDTSNLLLLAMFVGISGLTTFWVGACWLLNGAVVRPARAMANFEEVHWLIIITLALAYASALGAALGHALNPRPKGLPAKEKKESTYKNEVSARARLRVDDSGTPALG